MPAAGSGSPRSAGNTFWNTRRCGRKTRTRVSPKYLCVVVVVKPHDAFALPACLTGAVKKGASI